MICLGLFTAARVCEQVRAAVSLLPRGQKAALAMGLITLPRKTILMSCCRMPVSRYHVPPMTSEMMNTVKLSNAQHDFGGYGGAGRQTVGCWAREYLPCAYVAINAKV